ncbi:hypothetical protein [Chryseobacterium salivictor]|nr:hypothetical protein [Chryseobacterium salivictor]
MGKVHSLFEISGKVGDYVFYELNGQQVIRKAPSKKKGPKTEAQKSVALQNTEFGKASSAGKMLRVALAEECSRLHDRYLYQRVSKLMLRLKSCDGAPVGSRTVQGGLTTGEGQAALANFHFQKVQKNFPQLLNAVYRQGIFVSLFSLLRTPILQSQNFRSILRQESSGAISMVYPKLKRVLRSLLKKGFATKRDLRICL